MTMPSNSPTRLAAFLALALVVLGMASQAHAQAPPQSPSDAARALYIEGKDLRRSGNLEKSLEKLDAAHELYPTPITSLEVGRANALLGHYRKATTLLQSTVRFPLKPNESQKTTDARAEAATLIVQYREHLATLKIHVDVAGARVLVDGEALSSDADAAAYKVDPGAHHLVAELGARSTAVDVRIAEGEERSVVLALEEPAPPPTTPIPAVTAYAPEPAPASRPTTTAAVAHDVARDTPSSTHPLVYVGFGAAAVGALTGTITGVLTLSRASALESECHAGACLPDAHVGAAQTLGTISTLSFVFAGAGALLGSGALLFGGSAPTSSPKSVRIRPWLGLTSMGLRGELR